MQFSLKISAFTLSILALAFEVTAGPAPVVAADMTAASEAPPTDAKEGDTPFLMSVDEFKHWLATTDAEISFIGEPVNPLTPRAALATMVTFCATRFQNVCGGPCTVYNGGATCIAAPGTNCLAATSNVVFCAGRNCGGGCNQLNTCGTRLDNGFCFTPGTNSISVPP